MSKKGKWQPRFKWTHVVDVRDDVGVCGLGEAGPVDLQDLVGDLQVSFVSRRTWNLKIVFAYTIFFSINLLQQKSLNVMNE
jgi:hypothetical protein